MKEVTGTEFVNLETGEVVKISSYRTVEQEKAYQEKKMREKSRKKAKAFTFSNMENAKEVIQMLTTMELGYFLVLQTYIDYSNNALVKSSHNPTPMSRGDIGEVLGINNRSHVKKHIDNFLEKGLMIEKTITVDGKQVKAFCINEKYHFKGKTDNQKVVKAFSEQIRRIYNTNFSKKSKKQPADMGFLYLILPYIHYETNILCLNPFEPNPEAIEALSIADICRITGLDKKNVQAKLNNLKWDGMTVFAKVIKGRKTHLKVNPFVFYRKDGEPDNSLVTDFLIRGK
jgi:biotin operon repressor